MLMLLAVYMHTVCNAMQCNIMLMLLAVCYGRTRRTVISLYSVILANVNVA